MQKLGKKVGILNIGSELLVGHTLNTHASYLSNEFNALGYSVYHHISVGDNPERIYESLEFLAKNNDVIVCTGGLGPTLDDISRNIVADFLGLELVKDEKVMNDMTSFFANKGVKFTENNSSQAYFPEGAVILDNSVGTASGFMVTKDNLTIICMPGPPRELRNVMKSLKPYLEGSDKRLFNKFIHVFGIGESACADKIDDIFDAQTDPSIGIYASPGLIKFRLSTMKSTKEEADKVFEPVAKSLQERLERFVFSMDGEDLNEKLYNELKRKGLKIAFAESCTAGLASKFLTDVAGASEVFNLGIVTYSNEQKTERLGVSKDILDKHGAVSDECVIAMADGLFELSKADICVAISGVAGPSGATEKTPLGTVKIAIRYNGKNEAKTYNLIGPRDIVRENSVRRAFFDVIKLL